MHGPPFTELCNVCSVIAIFKLDIASTIFYEDKCQKMEDLSAVHQNLESVACSNVRVTPRSLSRSPSRSNSTKHHKTQKTYNRLDRKSHPFISKFLSLLNAKEAINPQSGYYTFILQPGAYEKTLKSLRQSDSEVWGYIQDELR